MDSLSRKYRTELGGTVADLIMGNGRARLGDDEFRYTLEVLSEHHYHLLIDGRSYSVFLTPLGDHTFRVTVNGKTAEMIVKTEREILL